MESFSTLLNYIQFADSEIGNQITNDLLINDYDIEKVGENLIDLCSPMSFNADFSIDTKCEYKFNYEFSKDND